MLESLGLWEVQLAAFLARSHGEREQRERVIKAKRVVDASPENILSLEEMARPASYAPTHFHKLFKREMGLTPHQYLTRKRIERARELLLTTDMAITDICMAVGFESLGSFSTLFRRHTGHSPSRYRRRYTRIGWDPTLPHPQHRALRRIPSCFLMRAKNT